MANYYSQLYGTGAPGLGASGYNPTVQYGTPYQIGNVQIQQPMATATPPPMATGWGNPLTGTYAQGNYGVTQGYNPMGTQAAGGGAPNTGSWLNQPMYGQTNPFASVPEEYWADYQNMLGSQLPAAQLQFNQDQYWANQQNNALNRQDSAAARAQSAALQWASLAQSAAQQGDNQKLAWAQQGLAQAKQALDTELGRAGVSLQERQLAQNALQSGERLKLDTRIANDSAQQAAWQDQRARENFGLQSELGRGNLTLQNASLAEQQRQAQAGEAAKAKEFGLTMQQTQDQRDQQAKSWARQQGLDQFTQAMTKAQFGYQKQQDQKNVDLQRELTAMSAFGRRIMPNPVG